ncbi:MAG: prepilin-type N-terminal cleavage/methylation domain-containing protein [Verrucomicrobiota bacterium]
MGLHFSRLALKAFTSWFSKSGKHTRHLKSSAFTLMELLVTIGIIALVIALASPTIHRSLFGGGSNKAVIEISNSVESARQFAISNGTYAYVAITEPDPDTGKIYIATIASRDSSPGGIYDLSRAKAVNINPSKNNVENFQLIGSITGIEECILVDELPETDYFREHPELGDDPSYFADGELFTYDSRVYGRLAFTRTIQFNPLGEAKVARALPGSIQLVVLPVIGGTPDEPLLDDEKASVIRIAGLTGRLRIFTQ